MYAHPTPKVTSILTLAWSVMDARFEARRGNAFKKLSLSPVTILLPRLPKDPQKHPTKSNFSVAPKGLMNTGSPLFL
jgi:hypothetical protein